MNTTSATPISRAVAAVLSAAFGLGLLLSANVPASAMTAATNRANTDRAVASRPPL